MAGPRARGDLALERVHLRLVRPVSRIGGPERVQARSLPRDVRRDAGPARGEPVASPVPRRALLARRRSMRDEAVTEATVGVAGDEPVLATPSRPIRGVERVEV